MLTLDETEYENMPKKAGKSREEKKSKGDKRNRRSTSSGRKLRSKLAKPIPLKIEFPEEKPSMGLSYHENDPVASSISKEIKVETSSSNEDEYIILTPLESLKDTEIKTEEPLDQCMQISKSRHRQKRLNKMILLRKCAVNRNNLSTEETEDESHENTSFEEDGRVPNIENHIYENAVEEQQKNGKVKREKIKWSKKLHPLSLYYTDRSKPYLKCPACGAMFFCSNTYQRHLHSHMQKIMESYVCDFCDYSHSEPGMLFAHLAKHQNQCESCNESLLRKDNFEKHLYQCSFAFSLKRDHHGRFVCTVCELVFDLLAQLEKHWFKHTCKKQKSYQCNECSGLYENLETLKNHKCLKCPVCGEVYESLHRLKIHTMWMKHYLKCPICSYEFILSTDHEKHLSLHRKVYQPMKDYMHCLRAADGKTFQCNLCDKIFYALPTLLSHLTEEHDVKSVKMEEADPDDNFELKGDIIDIVVVPDFKDSASYSDSCSDTNPLQQDTDAEDHADYELKS
ncbi:PREDICTED: zinc finger and BTB domain-containing protein 41-like [Dinoponera quadriceps]|uniref:Zinc finger and BTB domain-containing protein 41-like n=1 Tax=Dinoponera quadriceps TaxID=609295 RepID=A0A6P3YE61_DINQU|nr:PREDICTED: zinc finger and BTB domain-containing protein 41-like [Dinoponera quadriceps]